MGTINFFKTQNQKKCLCGLEVTDNHIDMIHPLDHRNVSNLFEASVQS